MSAASLYQWRHRLDATTPPLSSPTPPPRLVPLTVVAATLCELVLCSGRVLRFDPGLDPDRLQQFVRAAEAP